MSDSIKIIECPRDAMQGIHTFIPTEQKIAYINSLLKVGFDTIDFGSFVSPRAIPQLRDTAAVLDGLQFDGAKSHLLAIVANLRGAEDAASFEQIKYLGFPLSISETFQQRNTNKSIAEALKVVDDIQNLCIRESKEMVTYLSMGFGNPYGDPYNVEVVAEFADILKKKDIKIISLADTIASASPEKISALFTSISGQLPDIEVGVHLHTAPADTYEKIASAYKAGCKRIDSALLGFGGCPMAKDDLVGNLATEELIRYLDDSQVVVGLDRKVLQESMQLARQVFAVGN